MTFFIHCNLYETTKYKKKVYLDHRNAMDIRAQHNYTYVLVCGEILFWYGRYNIIADTQLPTYVFDYFI